mgnify:CR=1 FL=1
MEICASLYPLGEWAREVAGPDADVYLLEGEGGGPHSFTPSMRDVTRIGRAKALLAVGLGLDPWTARTVESSGSAQKTELLEAGTWVTRRKMAAHGDHDEHGEAAHHHGAAGEDPHVWLDPERAAQITLRLGEEFARLDPANAAGYRARAKACAEKLTRLAAELEALGKPLRGKKIVTQHDAYGYLFDRLGVELAGVVQLSPGIEPGTLDVSAAVRRMKAIGQRVVFSEPDREEASQALAEALGGKVVLLDNLERSKSSCGATYAERLRYDVKALVEHLP